jgi:hypothetical protein
MAYIPLIDTTILLLGLSNGQFGQLVLDVLELAEDAGADGVTHVQAGFDFALHRRLFTLAALFDEVTNIASKSYKNY